jgi:hypothetical protein
VLVRVEPQEFRKLAYKAGDPLVVTASGGLFARNYQYLMSYKGLAFYTKSNEELPLPPDAETVISSRIWIPG